jgi:hypothetical protein
MKKYLAGDRTEVTTTLEIDVPLGEYVSNIPLAELPTRLKVMYGAEEITLHMNGAALITMLMGLVDDVIEMTGRVGVSRMPGRSDLN